MKAISLLIMVLAVQQPAPPASPPDMSVPAGAARVEQTAPGERAPAVLVASFEGLGETFQGPQGTATLRNPSDNSLAVGPDHIVVTVNSRMAIFTKKGRRFDTTGTTLTGPDRIAVAPYRYLCGGQLTNCVPQPGSERRLDAQGDKLMARLVYRKLRDRESLVAVHSVNTSGGGGGVRWYEFQVDRQRRVSLRQQGTYAPDRFFRWMASPAIDRAGNIGIGYSFGGTPHFAGQRFAGRLAHDPLGQLSLGESVLVEGEAAQNAMRWEDYSQTAVDPSDDCTIWYVGDYIRKAGTNYSTRIGAFRMPGCGGQ